SRENKIEFAYDYGNLNASYVNEKINFKDDYFQEIINLDFEKSDSLFQQTSSLKPYILNVILEKIIIILKDEVMSLLEKEKENLKTIESLKSNGFESSENATSESENQSENDYHVIEKECDKVENPNVIAHGMFKLSVSQSVSPISMSKMSCESNNVKSKLKRKRRKGKSSKQNVKQVNNDVSRANSDFVHFSDLDTFSGVRRPKNSGVIGKKKGSSNTSNVDLSADQAWMESSSDFDREINANMVFVAQIEKITDQEVLFDKMSVKLVELDTHVRDLKNTVLEKDFKISELEKCVCNKDLEIEKCLERLNVCENKLHKMGQTNQTVHMIMPSKDNLYNGRKGIGFENPSYFEKAKDLRPTLYDEKVIGLRYTPMFFTHSNEALEIEKFKRSRENKIEFAYDYGNLNASYVNEKINFKDDYFQKIINPDFEKSDSLFQQTSSLKPYVLNVILEKIIIILKDEVMSLLEKEKENLKTIESLKSNGFESSENATSESENQSENDCHVIEKECDKVENPNVIAHGMFKLFVSQSVSPISMSKMSCESNNVKSKLKRKRRKGKSSKQNVKQVNNDVSRANSDFVHFSDLDTFSSVRRPKNSGVIRKKKGSSNTSNVDLSAVSHLKFNKNVKRYSRKDLLTCNNSHLGETSSAFVCNDAMNISCNSRMCDLLDDNNFFIFDDESVRISSVSKMPFMKKPCDSMNVLSKSNLNKSLPITVHKWLPELQPLAEPVAKWFTRVGRQIDNF
nr:hypothetical protein [Tanacetum cinerariifolium]